MNLNLFQPRHGEREPLPQYEQAPAVCSGHYEVS
jgi:hypothetical protein